MSKNLRILSLGAGVQSTVLALMAAHGEIETPDAAIFADTGWEPINVYTHLDWLESELPFPIHRVSIGHRLQDRLREGRGHSGAVGYIDIPKFQKNKDGSHSFSARRQCTTRYKIKPIRRKIREIMGYPGSLRIPAGLQVDQLLGISIDEFTRQRDSDVQFIRNVYPLIDLRMSRVDCQDWWAERYPSRLLAKSACVGCPFHSTAEWLHIRETEPEQFTEACEIDDAIRHVGPADAEIFLHVRRIPLREAVEVDAARQAKKDQMQRLADSQLSLWDEECTGFCGV